jgi:hypothetical protein
MKTIPLKEAEEKYGKVMKDGKDTYKSLPDSDKLFFWDWKTLRSADSDSGGDFLTRLDAMIAPHGLEVVKVRFDGDAMPWFIDKK